VKELVLACNEPAKNAGNAKKNEGCQGATTPEPSNPFWTPPERREKGKYSSEPAFLFLRARRRESFVFLQQEFVCLLESIAQNKEEGMGQMTQNRTVAAIVKSLLCCSASLLNW
jgi:hypothetical protein